jgi:hypothetical protein
VYHGATITLNINVNLLFLLMNHNSNDIIIQRQNNCISAATEIKFKSDDQNNAELISSFIPIDANSELDKRQTPFTRRFTRKQLLSRPGNRKERLLYNSSLATARCPLPCAEAGGEKSSCATPVEPSQVTTITSSGIRAA